MSAIPFQIIDVLTEDSFNQEHVPGSVNICVYEMAFLDRVRERFPDPATVLTVYGWDHDTKEAEIAQAKLAGAGYHNVTVLPGGLVGWKGRGGEVETGAAAATVLPANGTFPVDRTASVIYWTGRNLFNFHTGQVRLGEGWVNFEDGRLIGGAITVDMESLSCADLTDSSMNALLIAHLKSDDFFDVAEYPVARFAITAATFQETAPGLPNYHIRGEFTLRGVTVPVEFPAVIGTDAEGRHTAQAVFQIDRTQWGADYGSGRLYARLGKHLVNDLVELQLKIVTSAQADKN